MSSVSAPVSLSTKQNSQLWVLSSHSYFCKQIPPSFSFSLQPSRRIGEWVYFVEKVRKYFDRPTDRTLNRIKFWLLFFSSSGGFWNKRSGLEKALLVCLGVCGTVMVAGGSFYAAQQRNSGSLKKKYFQFTSYLFRDIKPPNHESCFPQFFLRNFLSLSSEKENKLLQVQNRFFLILRPNFVPFHFHLVKLRKIRGKNWGKQNSWFGGLMSQTRLRSNPCEFASNLNWKSGKPLVTLNFEICSYIFKLILNLEFGFSLTFWKKSRLTKKNLIPRRNCQV